MSSRSPSWFKSDRVQSLKRSLLTLRAKCCKLNSRLDAAERDKGTSEPICERMPGNSIRCSDCGIVH